MSGTQIALTVALVLGAGMAGISLREQLLTALLDTLCADNGCNPVGMAAAGWGVVGMPILLAGTVYAFVRPGKLALWAFAVAVSLLAGGLGARQAAAFRDSHPELALLNPGFIAALAALFPGAMIARFIPPKSERRRARQARMRRADPASLHFLVIVGCEIAVLVGVLIWVTLAA